MNHPLSTTLGKLPCLDEKVSFGYSMVLFLNSQQLWLPATRLAQNQASHNSSIDGEEGPLLRS